MIRPAARTFDFATVPIGEPFETAAAGWLDLDTAAETVSRDAAISTRRNPVARAMRMVGLLAFGQSLLFLMIWLLVCASVGAAPEKKPEFKPELQISTYVPTKTRDPFSIVGAGPGGAAPSTVPLQLEGILYSAAAPSAIVNGQLLSLNKVVYLTTPTGDIPLKAVEITRDRVVVMVGDSAASQKVKLFLNQPTQAPTPLK